MTDEEGFLAAIRAHPDDDLPRLAFADRLDDHGDHTRAEFVRVQLELEPMRFRLDEPGVLDLVHREAELLAEHREEWLGPITRIQSANGSFGFVFARGFPERLIVTLDTLLNHGEELFRTLPTLRELAVFGIQNRGAEFARCELLDRLDVLELADWPTPEDAAALLRSPHFGGQQLIRLWAGADVRQTSLLGSIDPAAWRPRGKVELVQLYGGLMTGDRARRYDDISSDFAGPFTRKWWPNRVTVVRPFRVWCPLLETADHDLRTGLMCDRGPALVTRTGDGAAVMRFGEHGDPATSARRLRFKEMDLDPWLDRTFGFRPGLIGMGEFERRFDGGGFRVSQWPTSWGEMLANPFAADEGFGGRVKRWLDAGYYVVSRLAPGIGNESFVASRRTGRIKTA